MSMYGATNSKPRSTESHTIKLEHLDPEYILGQSGWLGTPLKMEDIKKFLRNIETAVFKMLEHGFIKFQVSYEESYKINSNVMLLKLLADTDTIKISKECITKYSDPNPYYPTPHHSCYGYSEVQGFSFNRKKGVIPIKKLPLLINSPSPVIRLLAKTRLQYDRRSILP